MNSEIIFLFATANFFSYTPFMKTFVTPFAGDVRNNVSLSFDTKPPLLFSLLRKMTLVLNSIEPVFKNVLIKFSQFHPISKCC